MSSTNNPHQKMADRIGLVGFRFDENSSFMRGAAEGPPLIREAFFTDAANLWSESGLDLGRPGILFDLGDFKPAGREMLTQIEDRISSLLNQDLAPISLGGDHSITYPIIRAVAKMFPQLSVLHIDAHPDLYDSLNG